MRKLKQYDVFAGTDFIGTVESAGPVYGLEKIVFDRLGMPFMASYEVGRVVLSYEDGKEFTIYYK